MECFVYVLSYSLLLTFLLYKFPAVRQFMRGRDPMLTGVVLFLLSVMTNAAILAALGTFSRPGPMRVVSSRAFGQALEAPSTPEGLDRSRARGVQVSATSYTRRDSIAMLLRANRYLQDQVRQLEAEQYGLRDSMQRLAQPPTPIKAPRAEKEAVAILFDETARLRQLLEQLKAERDRLLALVEQYRRPSSPSSAPTRQ